MRNIFVRKMSAQKPRFVAALLAAAAVFAGSVPAQQTPAATSSQPGTAKSAKPAAKTPAKPTTLATSPKTSTAPALTTNKQKDSYALGVNLGRGLSKQPVDLDVTSLLRGMKDALQGTKPQLTDDQIKAALAQLSNEANAKAEAANAKAGAANAVLGEANLKQGEEFLASNKTKQGVVVLPSGLQYKILTAGNGPKPTAADTVVCDYRGTLINGQEFDSSYKRGQPASFPVSGVIKGWTEALQMMPVGSKWQLFIPPELAYGSRGAGADIGPNSTLVFEVELHSIQGK
jgi:FKBP-type peptidyl-prolyl cis-trans isomerase